MIESDLHNAIERKDAEWLRDLLEQGYAPDGDGLLSVTPLMRAAQLGLDEFVEILLAVGASINMRSEFSRVDDGGKTALLHAAERGKLSTCQLLLERGADPNISSEGGITALNEAARARNAALVDLLLAKGANPDGSGRCIETPLGAAAASQDIQIVRKLLLAGADPNLRTTSGTFPLIDATSPQIAAELIQHGADVNSRTADGKNALMYLIQIGSVELLGLHLAAGLDSNAVDKQGKTVLMLLSDAPRLELAELLVRSGADVNAKRTNGKSVLECLKEDQSGRYATKLERNRIIEFLQKHGAR